MGWFIKPYQMLQQCTFTTTAPAHNDKDVTFVDGKVEVFLNKTTAVLKGNILCANSSHPQIPR